MKHTTHLSPMYLNPIYLYCHMSQKSVLLRKKEKYLFGILQFSYTVVQTEIIISDLRAYLYTDVISETFKKKSILPCMTHSRI